MLVMAPTRELAQQVNEVSRDYADLFGHRSACLFGGASKQLQSDQMNRGGSLLWTAAI